MTLLAGCPGGNILEEAIPPGADYDFTSLAHRLVDNLTGPQREVYDAEERFCYLCSGRRFGKSYLAITRLITWAIDKPGGVFYYVTATYRMAKQIAWVLLKQLTPFEIFA